LAVYAGKKALALLRDQGLKPDSVKVMAGAAGGPKWLVLHGLDRAVFSLFKNRKRPLYRVGSSIGTWRFVAAVLGDTAPARVRESYIEQRYRGRPTARDVTVESRGILDQILGGNAPGRALEHPWYRLNILAVRGRHLVASENRRVQTAGLAGAVVANLAGRRNLKYFFERTLLYDRRDIPPFFNMDDFPAQKVPLSSHNLADAVMASGAIPLVMEGVKNIPGARPGTYRDGGMIDYHVDIDFSGGEGIVLYPHYTDRIVPGWLDKPLRWRRPQSPSMDQVVLLCPTREFVAGLPLGKIPDRDDFYLFLGRDSERIAYWRETVARSERLADEFMEALESGSLGALARPLPWE
jgi:hypothetical protein